MSRTFRPVSASTSKASIRRVGSLFRGSLGSSEAEDFDDAEAALFAVEDVGRLCAGPVRDGPVCAGSCTTDAPGPVAREEPAFAAAALAATSPADI